MRKIYIRPGWDDIPPGRRTQLPSGTSFGWIGSVNSETLYPLNATIVSANGSLALQCRTRSTGPTGLWSSISFILPGGPNPRKVTVIFDAQGSGTGWMSFDGGTHTTDRTFSAGVGIRQSWEVSGAHTLNIGSHNNYGASSFTLVIREICWNT
ncbi:hypothetical protein D3C77_470400 [compost metagenome]